MGGNQLQATVLWVHNDTWRFAHGWSDYLPGSFWAPAWMQWYNTQGKDGQEPVPEVKALFELHAKFMAAPPGSAESKAAYEEIIKSYHDNIWVFNPVEQAYMPSFWSKRIKNVPVGLKKDVIQMVAQMGAEQWYIDE